LYEKLTKYGHVNQLMHSANMHNLKTIFEKIFDIFICKQFSPAQENTENQRRSYPMVI